MAAEDRPTRVAIVGGGCAALSAAFELTQPAQQGRFEVTVYQMGWRLGGKGASSRGVAGRIEEHGLHLWLGFYENAFRQMRQCYHALKRDPTECPITEFDEAFFPDPVVSVAEHDVLGNWDVWSLEFPKVAGEPGLPGADVYNPGSYVERLVGILLAAVKSLDSGPSPSTLTPAEDRDSLLAKADEALAIGQLVGLSGIALALELAQNLLRFSGTEIERVLPRLLKRAHSLAHQQIDLLSLSDKRLRRLLGAIDVMLATLRGVYRFGLFTDVRGFDAIDDFEFMDWLKFNGARSSSIEAASIRASLYDLTFAYRDGNPSEPAFAAGVALRCAFRWFFSYRGAMFWKMAAGMGDIVFAPLYEVLRERGVRFEFFHRLRNVELAADSSGRHVSAMLFDVQAEVRDGTYEPLVEVKGLPVWPDKPLFDQLERIADPDLNFESEDPGGAVGQKRLQVNRDFDLVVMGVSMASLKNSCAALAEDSEAWRAMFDQMTTVATQSAQLWMRPTIRQLGYNEPKGNLSGFVTPFDTWADMSHLAELEAWPEPPGSIAYFCSVLPEEECADGPAGVRENARRFIGGELRKLWPRLDAIAPGNLFVQADGGLGEGCLESQYFRANAHGSERYVQTLPGSTRFRISPLDRTYDNLTVAGDWTANGLNAGCVEAAVMSGMLASHALSGFPALEEIVGYDHP